MMMLLWMSKVLEQFLCGDGVGIGCIWCGDQPFQCGDHLYGNICFEIHVHFGAILWQCSDH